MPYKDGPGLADLNITDLYAFEQDRINKIVQALPTPLPIAINKQGSSFDIDIEINTHYVVFRADVMGGKWGDKAPVWLILKDIRGRYDDSTPDDDLTSASFQLQGHLGVEQDSGDGTVWNVKLSPATDDSSILPADQSLQPTNNGGQPFDDGVLSYLQQKMVFKQIWNTIRDKLGVLAHVRFEKSDGSTPTPSLVVLKGRAGHDMSHQPSDTGGQQLLIALSTSNPGQPNDVPTNSTPIWAATNTTYWSTTKIPGAGQKITWDKQKITDFLFNPENTPFVKEVENGTQYAGEFPWCSGTNDTYGLWNDPTANYHVNKHGMVPANWTGDSLHSETIWSGDFYAKNHQQYEAYRVHKRELQLKCHDGVGPGKGFKVIEGDIKFTSVWMKDEHTDWQKGGNDDIYFRRVWWRRFSYGKKPCAGLGGDGKPLWQVIRSQPPWMANSTYDEENYGFLVMQQHLGLMNHRTDPDRVEDELKVLNTFYGMDKFDDFFGDPSWGFNKFEVPFKDLFTIAGGNYQADGNGDVWYELYKAR